MFSSSCLVSKSCSLFSSLEIKEVGGLVGKQGQNEKGQRIYPKTEDRQKESLGEEKDTVISVAKKKKIMVLLSMT